MSSDSAFDGVVFSRWASKIFGTTPWYVVWGLVVAFVGGVTVYLSLFLEGSTDAFLGITLCQVVGFISVPAAFEFSRKQLNRWVEGLDDFVNNDVARAKAEILAKFSLFEGTKDMYFAGLALGIAAPLIYFFGDYFEQESLIHTLFGMGVIAGSGFFAGMGLWAIFAASRAIWQFGRSHAVRVDTHRFGVLSTGRTLIRCYFIVALTWSVYVLSAIAGTCNFGELNCVTRIPMIFIACPAVLFFIIAFFLSLWPLHTGMLKFKRNEIRKLDTSLEQLRSKVTSAISQQDQTAIEFLIRRKKEVLSLPEWPFSRNSIAGVFLTSSTSVFPLIVDFAMSGWAKKAIMGILAASA